jgi:asparagine synthase (glutamine-hydrolysing)
LALKRGSGRELFPPFINEDFAKRIGLAERMRLKPRYPGWISFARQSMYDNFVNGWVTHGLETNDRTTAHFGVEERHPFHDRRLVEFVFAVPDQVRCRARQRKWVLREAMRGRIPERIRSRGDKADFSIMFVKLLEQLDVDKSLRVMALEQAGWINSAEFRRILGATLADYENMNLWPVWNTFALELWYNAVFLNGKTLLGQPFGVPADAVRSVSGN